MHRRHLLQGAGLTGLHTLSGSHTAKARTTGVAAPMQAPSDKAADPLPPGPAPLAGPRAGMVVARPRDRD